MQLALTICILACIGLQSTQAVSLSFCMNLLGTTRKEDGFNPINILTMDSTPGLSCFIVKFSSANLAPAHQGQLSRSKLQAGSSFSYNDQAAAAQP